MRIKIWLACPDGILRIPYNYNYFLASAIYAFLRESAPDFAEFLHTRGYRGEEKSFKLFTFSPLLAPQRKALKQEVLLSGKMHWLISSPKEDFLTHLAEGILQAGSFSLLRDRLIVEQVEVLSSPSFDNSASLRALSPIVVSTGERLEDGTFGKRYLSPFETKFYQVIEENLRRKYHTCHGKEAPQARLWFKIDEQFVSQRRRLSKLIDYKGIKIRGWLFPFEAGGNPELIKMGYEAGFGEANSAGFGMVEVTDHRK